MSLNKLTGCEKGHGLNLQIGCDVLEANNVVTDNIDVSTINGILTSALASGGPAGPQGPAGADGEPGPNALGQSGVGALTARPITVELPCNASLFNTSNTTGRQNLIVVIDSDGKIRPSLRFNPDSEHALILNQVTNGVAVRMAVLYLLCGAKQES